MKKLVILALLVAGFAGLAPTSSPVKPAEAHAGWTWDCGGGGC